MGQDALLDNILKASEGAHNDVPVLPHHIDPVVDIAAERRREERLYSEVRIDECPARSPVRVKGGSERVLAGSRRGKVGGSPRVRRAS